MDPINAAIAIIQRCDRHLVVVIITAYWTFSPRFPQHFYWHFFSLLSFCFFFFLFSFFFLSFWFDLFSFSCLCFFFYRFRLVSELIIRFTLRFIVDWRWNDAGTEFESLKTPVSQVTDNSQKRIMDNGNPMKSKQTSGPKTWLYANYARHANKDTVKTTNGCLRIVSFAFPRPPLISIIWMDVNGPIGKCGPRQSFVFFHPPFLPSSSCSSAAAAAAAAAFPFLLDLVVLLFLLAGEFLLIWRHACGIVIISPLRLFIVEAAAWSRIVWFRNVQYSTCCRIFSINVATPSLTAKMTP